MNHDLIVIGGGPAGYVAAIRGAQLGLNVACIEKEDKLGGTCLRVGCIPSKAMLESSHKFEDAQKHFADHGIDISEVKLNLKKMMARKDKVVSELASGICGLLKKNKITSYKGTGEITAKGKVTLHTSGGDEELTAKHILIATGSVSSTLPGIELDGVGVGTSTEALCYDKVPDHLVVIGAGVIGLELGCVWSRLGAKVTVLEYFDRILPGMDAEIAKEALKLFKRQGLAFKLKTRVTSAKRAKNGKCLVEYEGAPPMEADKVLVAVGRKANTDGLGLESVGIELGARGIIPVDDRYQTQVEGIYAVGDVIDGPMLAHKAEEEGIACVNMIAGKYGHVNYDAIPGVTYTNPEIASVGQTEEQLKEAGVKYKKGGFPFLANGRAKANGDTAGKVKVLADAETDRILGVHIIGPHAGDLLAEAVAAIEFGASAEDLAMVCHSHPSLSEAVKEASMAVAGEAIHM